MSVGIAQSDDDESGDDGYSNPPPNAAELDRRLTRALRVRDAAILLFAPTPLPTWMSASFMAQALFMLETEVADVSLRSVAAELSRRSSLLIRPRPRGKPSRYGLPDTWQPHDDDCDGQRLQIVAKLILAAVDHPDEGFIWFSRERFLHDIEEFGLSIPESTNEFMTTARRMATGGSTRTLATLPSPDILSAIQYDMPNFAEVAQFYAGQCALRAMQGQTGAAFPPVLLVGPPGVGKTMFTSRLAECIGSPTTVVPMAAASNGWLLGGLDRSWHSGKAGKVFLTMLNSRVANPVIVVDEIDKCSDDTRYDPLGALYSLLEEDSARDFIDEYACTPVNASKVIWIATANDVNRIPRALLSRFTIFDVASPNRADARRIVMGQFRRIVGTAAFEPLTEIVIDALLDMPPRKIGTVLRAAVGTGARRAASETLPVAEVRLEDLTIVEPKPSIGFA